MTPRVLIATAHTEPGTPADRLLALVAWLQRRGIDVEIVALGDGAALRRYRRTAKVTVVDEMRRKGPARLPYLLGADQLAVGIKSVRLRRWLRRRSDRAIFVHDPLAASLLRYLDEPPARVVAGLAESTQRLEDLRPEDRASLEGAVCWVVATEEQAAAVAAATGRPAEVLGTMIDRDTLRPVRSDLHGGALVVLTSAAMWDQPDHAVELTWQLLRDRPATPVRWLVQGQEAAWLARHDLEHAGLGGRVQLLDADEPDALDGIALLVRSGYEPERDDIVLTVALGGVPVLGWAEDDLIGPSELAPGDVEGAVDRVCRLLDDPPSASDVGQRVRDRLADIDLDRLGRDVLALLSDAGTGP